MEPVNPMAQAITAGATFVARGFSGDQKGLVNLMVKAIRHKGFAVVDILQPCATWNHVLTWKYYNEHTYSLQENGHDVTDKIQALEKAMENGERYPTGVFYSVERPCLASGIALPEKGALKDHTTDMKEVQKIIDDLML